jgi:hypothetical protein
MCRSACGLKRSRRSPRRWFCGGATEIEHILGNKASEANIAHRTLLLAYTHIKAFEQRRAAGRLP